MKKTIFILMALVLGMTACNKDEALPVSSLSQNSSNIAYSLPSRIVSDQFIDSLANFHNEYLTSVIDSYDFNAISHSTEMLNEFESIGLNNLNLSQNQVSALLDNPDSNYNYVVSHVDDTDVKLIMDNVKNYIINNPNSSFLDISNLVATQESYARSNITGSDLDISLAFLKTFEKSSYLWMSISQGGLGLGDQFIDNLDLDDQDDIPAAINWSLVAWADGAGAARSLYIVWIAAAGGPIAWGAAAAAMGWSAAYASGATLIGQLLLA